MRGVSRGDGEDVELVRGLADSVEMIAVIPEDLVDGSLGEEAGVSDSGVALVEEETWMPS